MGARRGRREGLKLFLESRKIEKGMIWTPARGLSRQTGVLILKGMEVAERNHLTSKSIYIYNNLILKKIINRLNGLCMLEILNLNPIHVINGLNRLTC